MNADGWSAQVKNDWMIIVVEDTNIVTSQHDKWSRQCRTVVAKCIRGLRLGVQHMDQVTCKLFVEIVILPVGGILEQLFAHMRDYALRIFR